MKIGLLQCGYMRPALVDRHGDYPRLYGDLLGPGFDWRTWLVCDGEMPSAPNDADGWLVSGSRHGAYEDHDWIPGLERFIRDIDVARRPLVGICFGHQIVAQALGGLVQKYPGGWAVGLRTYQTAQGPIDLNAWHQDQVTEPPPRARITHHNDFTAIAGFEIDDHIRTLQPHPEFSPAVIADMIPAVGRGTVSDDRLAEAEAALTDPTDAASTGASLAAFFRKHRP